MTGKGLLACVVALMLAVAASACAQEIDMERETVSREAFLAWLTDAGLEPMLPAPDGDPAAEETYSLRRFPMAGSAALEDAVYTRMLPDGSWISVRLFPIDVARGAMLGSAQGILDNGLAYGVHEDGPYAPELYLVNNADLEHGEGPTISYCVKTSDRLLDTMMETAALLAPAE